MSLKFGGKLGVALLSVPLILLQTAFSFADPIPSDRKINWQGIVGVPGGIPNRTTIYQTISSSLGNGTTDAQPAINGAVNSCPADQVVKLPDGVFLLNAMVRPGPTNKSNFTIRGNGRGRTILKVNNGTAALYFGSADWPYRSTENSQAITSGATAGSSVMTVGSTSSFTVGNLVHVSQSDITYTIGNDGPRNMIVMAKVVAKDATHVTLDHALPITMTNSPILVPYPTAPTVGVGVEDLTIDVNNMAAQGVAFEQSYGCWLKNVEIKNSPKKEAVLIEFNNGEIRHCTFHDEIYLQPGVGREHEGLDFYIRSCWNLVEDNIFSNGGFAPITIGDSRGGCVGNVIGYNFVEKVNTATEIAGGAISFAHGGHNMFNLMEGNVVESGLSADGYWGSSSHNTMLRNWAAAKPYSVSNPPGYGPTNVYNVSSSLRAVQLNRWNYFMNVVGNVLGDSAFPTTSRVRGVYNRGQRLQWLAQADIQPRLPIHRSERLHRNMGTTNAATRYGRGATRPDSW